MKKIIFLFLLVPTLVMAQYTAESYQYRKASLYEELGVQKNNIVFIGSDIADNAELAELFGNRHIINRGIRSEKSTDILTHIERIIEGKPHKIFVQLGTDDLMSGIGAEQIAADVSKMIELVREGSPRTRLYILSIAPVNDEEYRLPKGYGDLKTKIRESNQSMETICKAKGVTYINVFDVLADTEGNLQKDYTNDGIHLTGEGYLLWRDTIKKHLK